MREPAPGMLVTPSVRLVRRHGRGAMGSVWIADHAGLDTQVVVKFMSQALTAHPDLVARFKREASAASNVKSPHVVQTLDHGITDEGLPFIIMELLEGRDLQKHLAEHGKLPPRDVAIVVTQVAKALSRAHARGIVHRDIKPSNIFLCDVGGGETFVKVLDFGIAKALHAAAQPYEPTETGVLVGTPYFMSPEQLKSGPLDPRCDVWALGVVAFRALTGVHPFKGDSLVSLAVAIQMGPVPVPSEVEPSLPRGIDAWFAKACARDVEARHPTVRALAEGLVAALDLRDVMSVPTFEVSSSGEVPALDANLPHDTATFRHEPLELDTGAPKVEADATKLDSSTYGAASYAPRPSVPGRAQSRRVLSVAVVLLAMVGIIALGVVLLRKPEQETHGPRAVAAGLVVPSAEGLAPSASASGSAPGSLSSSASAASSLMQSKIHRPLPDRPKTPPPTGPKPAGDDPFGDHRK